MQWINRIDFELGWCGGWQMFSDLSEYLLDLFLFLFCSQYDQPVGRVVPGELRLGGTFCDESPDGVGRFSWQRVGLQLSGCFGCVCDECFQ